MRSAKYAPAILVTLLANAGAFANDFEKLCKEGYGVLFETEVNGDFKGCEFGKTIAFTNGLLFRCSGYSYSYAYNPDVYILKSVKTGDIKVIIDDEEYDGTVFKPR